MNISIAIIKINSISNVGSFNVGKTILCKNSAKSESYSHVPSAGEEPEVQAPVQAAPPTPTVMTP